MNRSPGRQDLATVGLRSGRRHDLVHGIGVVQPGEPAEAGLAEQGQMDRERQRAEAGIGADVAGRLLAADMLLAGRERQHVAAPAVDVDGLAAEPAGQLAHVFLGCRHQPDIGAAEAQRIVPGAIFEDAYTDIGG